MDRPPRSSLSFPSRRYADLSESIEPIEGLAAGYLYAFVLGIDATPRALPADTLASFDDPMATLLFGRGVFPLTMRALLAALDGLGEAGLPRQRSFLVGDGAKLQVTGQALDRQLRYAVTRSGPDRPHDLLISTGVDIDSPDVFLQVIAWDRGNRWFNYYQRQGAAWVWSGSSLHALDARSRGKGCFDSHVNGSLVMKERKAPWLHWHSMSASIHATCDPRLAGEPLFEQRQGAQVLQVEVVEPGIRRWTRARLAHQTAADGTLSDGPAWLRHVLETTTVNLVTTTAESRLLGPNDTLTLPITFFVNAEAFFDLIGLDSGLAGVPRARGSDYLDSLVRYQLALVDSASGFRQAGDTHFAFAVPEPAFEDLDVLAALLERGILSRRMAASLLMVDFPNPVDSPRRRTLMRYVPPSLSVGGSEGLAEAIVAAAPATAEGSPERELAALWAAGDTGWETAFAARLETYLLTVGERALTSDGFDEYARLAESRRRRTRRRPLLEFDLTLPRTNIPPDSPSLRLLEDGTVAAVTEPT